MPWGRLFLYPCLCQQWGGMAAQPARNWTAARWTWAAGAMQSHPSAVACALLRLVSCACVPVPGPRGCDPFCQCACSRPVYAGAAGRPPGPWGLFLCCSSNTTGQILSRGALRSPLSSASVPGRVPGAPGRPCCAEFCCLRSVPSWHHGRSSLHILPIWLGSNLVPESVQPDLLCRTPPACVGVGLQQAELPGRVPDTTRWGVGFCGSSAVGSFAWPGLWSCESAGSWGWGGLLSAGAFERGRALCCYLQPVWLHLPCGVGQLYAGGLCAVLSGRIQPCTPVCGCMAFQVAGEGAGVGGSEAAV